MSPEIKPKKKKRHDLKVTVITGTRAFLLLMNLETLGKTVGSRWQVDRDDVGADGAEGTKSAVFLIHLRNVGTRLKFCTATSMTMQKK